MSAAPAGSVAYSSASDSLLLSDDDAPAFDDFPTATLAWASELGAARGWFRDPVAIYHLQEICHALASYYTHTGRYTQDYQDRGSSPV